MRSMSSPVKRVPTFPEMAELRSSVADLFMFVQIKFFSQKRRDYESIVVAPLMCSDAYIISPTDRVQPASE